MGDNLYLIGSYHINKNIFVIFDRKIASSLITLYYDEPFEIYKTEDEFIAKISRNKIDIKNIKFFILTRNPITRIKSYLSERVFKQLYHFHNKKNYEMDGYDEEIQSNPKTIELFKSINSSNLDLKLLDNDTLNKWVEHIIVIIKEYMSGKNNPTNDNEYDKRLYNFLKKLNLKNIELIDVVNIKNNYNRLGIDIKDDRFVVSESHRNTTWNSNINQFYPYLKKHKEWNGIKDFFKSNIIYHRMLFKEYSKFKINELVVKNIL